MYEPWKFLDREGETEYISGLLALGFELMRRVERGQYGGINFWTEIGALAREVALLGGKVPVPLDPTT